MYIVGAILFFSVAIISFGFLGILLYYFYNQDNSSTDDDVPSTEDDADVITVTDDESTITIEDTIIETEDTITETEEYDMDDGIRYPQSTRCDKACKPKRSNEPTYSCENKPRRNGGGTIEYPTYNGMFS